MADDLVERLRNGAALLKLMDEHASERQSTAASQRKMLEAADEIERLQAYARGLIGRQDVTVQNMLERTEAAEAEVARLRRAIEGTCRNFDLTLEQQTDLADTRRQMRLGAAELRRELAPNQGTPRGKARTSE